ncbi:MAG: ATP-binding cassette domain-containing protein [Actinomycetota bacterium]|nr:ATP-binding cassette domain-containing protein [Actinomycetota bacterium]
MHPVLALDHVGVARGSVQLLKDVTATIEGGRCTALVGPSGAGKSTLLRLLNRFDDPTEGTVTFQGEDLRDLDVLDLRRRVGLVAQRPTLLEGTVRAELRVAVPELTDDAARHLLIRTGLDDTFLDRATTTLSGGEAQRLCLARALTVNPEVLLLDEPTSSLDAKSAQAVEETIEHLAVGGLTVVLVSHDREQAHRLADHVIVLDKGRLTEQGPVETVDYLRGRQA